MSMTELQFICFGTNQSNLNDDEKEIWNIGVIAVDNLHKYGAPTWREWTYKNWDTKWNAYDFDEMSEENNTIYFQAAWYALVPAILNLSQKYPNIEMSMKYADEDLGHNCGTVVFKKGSITEEKYPETRKEALKFSAEMWDTELDSYSLRINQTGTDYVSTWKKDFELVELFGKLALFTNKRLNPGDVPLLGLLTFEDNMLLGIGMMMAASEVPRIAERFGLDTSVKFNMMSAVHMTSSVVNLVKTVAK